MKENTLKHYSVRSARRRKAKNKSKAVKRAHAIRVACAVKPTEDEIRARRGIYAEYLMSLSCARQFSWVDTNTVTY